MTSIRASLIASSLLHVAVVGGVGWFAASAAGLGAVQAEIRVQFEAAPTAIEPRPANDLQVTIETTHARPAGAEPRLPDEWLDPRLFEPAPPPPESTDEAPRPAPSPAVWFTRVRPAPADVVELEVEVEALPPDPARATPAVEVIPGANPPPEYPWHARRRGLEGIVAISVAVDAAGAVATASIAKTSRHAILDAAAVSAVRGWRFRNGPGTTVVEVEFALRAPR